MSAAIEGVRGKPADAQEVVQLGVAGVVEDLLTLLHV
jgi:hypothetical protein